MKRPQSARGHDRTPKAPAASTVPTAQTAPAPGGGQALPSPLLQRMQHAMGHDFSSVRVHTDAGAAALTRSLGAAAVTQGRDIAFAPGHYRPASREGLSLLAHELTHVAQPKAAHPAAVAAADHPSEREADRVADTVAAGGRAVPQAQAGGVLQREPLPGQESLPGGDSLLDGASPILASVMGSATLEGFAVGESALTADHRSALKMTAYNIRTLSQQYPLSAVQITGYADGPATTLEAAALAHGRANAARDALIDAGVRADMIAASGSREAAADGKGRVDVRFEPKRLFAASLMPKLDLGPKPSFALPGASGGTATGGTAAGGTAAGGFSPGAYGLGLGLSGLTPPVPKLQPWSFRNALQQSGLPQGGPFVSPPISGPSAQPKSSGLPSIDLDLSVGPVTITLPKEIKAKLPLPLRNAARLVFDLEYEAPAKFGLKITLDGIPHVTVALKGGAEYDVKEGQATASGGLVIESARQVCIADDKETLRAKVKASGDKLNKAVKEFGEATTTEDRMSKGTDIAGAIGEIYEAVEKSKKSCSNAPRWTLEFGYKGLIDPGKETDPTKWPPAHYFGLTWTWRFGGKKK